MHVSVEQRSVDVIVRLFAPDGQQLAMVDKRYGNVGAEAIRIVATMSGEYLLDVRPVGEHPEAGRYRVCIEEFRPASDEDEVRIPALQIYEDASGLLALHTADSMREAIAKFAEGRRMWHAIGDREQEAAALLGMGEAYNQLGEYEQGLALFDQGLSFWRPLGDGARVASILTEKGESYYYLSEYQKALECYDESLAICETIRRPDVRAWTLNNIGSVYDVLGDKEKALDYYHRAFLIYTRMDPGYERSRGTAITHTNMGGVYVALGDSPKALDHLMRALPGWRAVSDRWGEARMLHRIGLAHAASGDTARALTSYDDAVRLWREQGDRFNEAKTVDATGLAYLAGGDSEKALSFFQQALATRRAIRDRQGEAAAHYHIARAELHRGNLMEARANIEQALARAESVRTKVASNELRSSYLAAVREYYEFYIDLLMQLHRLNKREGFDGVALSMSERARARTLIEMLVEARVDIREGVDPRLLEEERDLQHRINATDARLRQLSKARYVAAVDVAAAASDIDAMVADLERVGARIRRTSPRYAALTQPQPLTCAEIQERLLNPDTMLLEYAMGDERSFLWAVTPASITTFELPGRAEIEMAIRRFYELLTARNKRDKRETLEQRRVRLSRADGEYPDAARTLSRLLLQPVAGQLANKRLLIVTDGALQYVPFAALPILELDGESAEHGLGSLRPLIAEHEIVNLPSASVLAVLRQQTVGRAEAPKRVAVLADPVFDEMDPRLGSARRARTAVPGSPRPRVPASLRRPSDLERSASEVGASGGGFLLPRLLSSRQEAASILNLVASEDRKGALDFDASRETATNPELGEYRIVHFATHGLLNSVHPDLSGVVLSLVDRRGEQQDGFLRLHEIYNLKLPADLVVLSACQTGLGKEIRGEGLIGLTRGFMYAGAPRVVASLWKVDDEATAELMKRFYEGMLNDKQTPAAALRNAQIAMWKQKRWQSPFYWAAFTLQGEWK
ncbi:MAG TPA: CHAT domain-containing tetratricopeptide repeat protein [Blastocatellia bacterium]|nr:CHAT domain-containing tetratricopeptide repeat protein [Blastocatellia bacterium]